MTSASHPGVLHHLVDEQLYDRGVLSVKFRVLHGRVVFFRPFVRRRTATTSAASRYVDRVIFVVATTGELVIADADALPKRSVPLRHVTTILLDAAASTVALMFESSAAEHDVQLVFGPYPPGLGDNSTVSAASSVTSRALGSPSGRVTFSDHRNLAQQRDDENAQSSPSCHPLLTPKQFIHTVLAYAPGAQVIQGTVASMELKLARPKFFVDPTPAVASLLSQSTTGNAKPREVDQQSLSPAQQSSDKTSFLASPIVAGEQDVSVLPAEAAASPPATAEINGSAKKFRDLYPAASQSGVRKNHGEDSDAALASDFATPRPTAPPPSTPSPARQQSGERNEESSTIIRPQQSLRDIAANGTFNTASNKKAPLQPTSTDNDDSLHQFQNLEPPYDRPHGHQQHEDDGNFEEDEAPSTSAVDTGSALRRFSLLHRKANEWNDGEGYASRTLAGGSPYQDGAGVVNRVDDIQNPNDPPLLSDMVRKLRSRRGEIQMQNLMMDGEIKGLQQRIDAILTSYQRVNPLAELDDYPVHRRSANGRGAYHHRREDPYSEEEHLATNDDVENEEDHFHSSLFGATSASVVDTDDDLPKLMSATKEYNRALNLSLVLLNICRRQRQIHLHAEYDARERWRAMQRRGGGYPTTTGSISDGSSTYGLISSASVPYHGNVFMGPDAALMLRSSYSEGSRTIDMQRLVAMGF